MITDTHTHASFSDVLPGLYNPPRLPSDRRPVEQRLADPRVRIGVDFGGD